jgi:hypothetical protein
MGNEDKPLTITGQQGRQSTTAAANNYKTAINNSY